MMDVKILRLGHRHGRDKRLTTHVCLTSRALGASNVLYSGDEDSKLEENIEETSGRWGGNFNIQYIDSWKKILENFDGVNVHLTMYGESVQDKIKEIRETEKDILVIVGSQKVPGEIYDLVDYNVAVTNQPHSEVAALSIFLHELFQGDELDNEFKNPELKIVPRENGKEVIKND
ncbi:MAG: tRNA (cytidine(56)-2'-O)-methyltransferase [Candidatus Aenigmatarchaeota archaeon]